MRGRYDGGMTSAEPGDGPAESDRPVWLATVAVILLYIGTLGWIYAAAVEAVTAGAVSTGALAGGLFLLYAMLR